MGCFAMTETGHGSNVQALGTVAAYDAGTREFVITTPVTERATRPARTTSATPPGTPGWPCVFAQLETGGEGRGVHAFVVPIRDESGAPAAGVRIEDDGLKLGLNGVDNGRLWFDGVRVPRAALLDRFADVAEDGALLQRRSRTRTAASSRCWARWCRAGSAWAGPGINAAKVALAIAVRYGVRRRQFEAVDAGRGAAAARLRDAPAAAVPAAGPDVRAALRPGGRRRCSCTTCSPGRPTTRRPGASWSRAPPAPRRSAPGTPPGRSRSAGRRAAGRGTSPSTGSPRSRPTPTCSRRSRATTTCCSSSWPRGC